MSSSAADGARQLVLAEIGATVVSIAADSVAGALAWPAALDILPRRRGALLGVFDHMGRATGVLDLALWVGLGAAPAATGISVPAYQRIVILQAKGRRVAIGVDRLRGLQKVAGNAIERISHDDDPDELFHSTAQVAGVAGRSMLLDVERLMDLSNTWSEDLHAAAPADATAQAGPHAAAAEACGVVAAGGCSFAFPIAELAEVLPVPPLSPFRGRFAEGLCLWRGRYVPVTSLAKCFPELTSGPGAAPSFLAVFLRDGLALGMLLHQVPDIVLLPRNSSGPHFLEGDEGRPLHLIDMGALHARFPEASLSRIDGTATAVGTAATCVRAHLVYDAGGRAATPLDGIEALMALPDLVTGSTHLPWRGAALPVHDMRAATGESGTVIVIRGRDGARAVIVERVHALIAEGSARSSQLRMAGGGAVELLTVGAGAAQLTYPVRALI